MTWTVAAYVSYLVIALPLTVWVAAELTRNGRIFLADVFDGKAELAQALNKLLVVGFYLLNVGFVMVYLRSGSRVHNLTELLEGLSMKIGIVMLVVGAIHFLNVYVFSSIRSRSRFEARLVPQRPSSFLPPPPPGFPAPQAYPQRPAEPRPAAQ